MTERRKKAIKQILFGVALLAIAGVSYWFGDRTPKVASFDECAEAGYSVMESYPRQCRMPDGKTFKEDIGNELETDDLVRISEPRPNTTIKSPLTVKGMARGSWFFEASFPVRLFDGNGEMLAHVVARAKSSWMTTEFVPFETELSFAMPTTTAGTLILDRDNPSGLPENAMRFACRYGLDKTQTDADFTQTVAE